MDVKAEGHIPKRGSLLDPFPGSRNMVLYSVVLHGVQIRGTLLCNDKKKNILMLIMLILANMFGCAPHLHGECRDGSGRVFKNEKTDNYSGFCISPLPAKAKLHKQKL